MKTLSLDLSFDGLNLSDKDKSRPAEEVMVLMVKDILLGWGAQDPKLRMTEESRYLVYKMCDALDLAVKNGEKSVQLDDAWASLLKRAKREVGMVPNELIRRVEDLIDAVPEK